MSMLSGLIAKSKTVSVEYPGLHGFKVELAYLTRDELMNLRKKAINTKIDRRTRQPVEELDSDLFQTLYIKAVVKGWSGFNTDILAKLVPVKNDVEFTEIPYGPEEAEDLMKNSPDFDSFVSDTVSDLENFSKSS